MKKIKHLSRRSLGRSRPEASFPVPPPIAEIPKNYPALLADLKHRIQRERLKTAMTYPHDTEEWIFSGYVLSPLFNLGLIEKRVNDEWPSITDKDEIRLTELWRKFIEFDQRVI